MAAPLGTIQNPASVQTRMLGVGRSFSRCYVFESGSIYRVVRQIRECIYGYVKLAIRVQNTGEELILTDERVAIKQMNIECVRNRIGFHTRQRVREDPLHELEVMEDAANPGHDNVLRFYEFGVDERYYYTVMEFIDGGELFELVESRERLDEDIAKILFRQILLGLSYLHEKNISHRDMSLENILVSRNQENWIAKLIDFGLSCRVQRNRQGEVELTDWEAAIGKTFYMSPEIYGGNDGDQYDALKTDIWSCGIMLFIMVSGVPLCEVPATHDPRFEIVANGRLRRLISDWKLDAILSPDVIGALREKYHHLLESILVVNPEARPTIQDILNHQWMN